MARIKEDLVRLKSGYVLSLRMITMCIVPLSLGLSALSEVFVDSVLGVTWVKAVFPLTVLSIQGLLNALVTPAGNVLVSIGKPRYMSIQTSVQALLLIALIYPAALYYGIDGVCILTTLLSLGVLVFFVILLPSVLSSTMRELYGPLLRPLASGGAMFVILVVLADLVEHTLPMLVLLAVLGLCIYIGLIYITSRGRDIRDFIDLFVVMRSGQ